MSERFEVTTAENGDAAQSDGLIANVVDRLYNSHVVASFQGEQRARGNGNGSNIGDDEALWRARAHAKHMNAVYG